MSAPMHERTLALAGLIQAASLVRQIATSGDAETAPLTTCIDSVFRIDADSPEAVYGGADKLERGLRGLLRQLDGGGGRDPALSRLAYTVLHVERRFAARPKMMEDVRSGLGDIARQQAHWGPTHPTVLARLGELYAGTVSHLRPRVLVQGNPSYLGQPTVVAEIRAVLLAALRSAVLWRQLGGSYWDFVFSRRALAQAARELLGEHAR